MAALFRRILVPHDFSVHATAALKVASELAARHGGRLTVLHVLTPFYTGPGFPSREEIAWAPGPELLVGLRQQLEMLVDEALGRGPRRPPVRCRVVTGDAMRAIVDAARRSDSIVMATVGRTGLAHLLLGSVAEKVVRHAPVPVLTIRPEVRRRRAAAPSRRRRGPRPARA